MVHAIRIHQTGGPEQLHWDEVDPGSPGPGQARVRHGAVGVNYIDTYHRTGLYPLPLPAGIGMEGAGVVTEVGPDVPDLKAGDRVAYAGGPPGSYAEERVMPADRLVKLPDGINDKQAAGMMLRGMTVQYLLESTFPVKRGQTILVHAAAGGVGLILCQWAKHIGATVIGTVGSEEKAKLARANGCDHPILYKTDDFTKAVKDITGGEGVPVVYDGVGKDTFSGSLDCLSPRGMMVLFGAASGPVPPFDLSLLASKGSLFITRPTLFTYTAKRPDLLASAESLFKVVTGGAVKIDIGQEFPLKDAAEAHRALEGRRTTGSTILIP
ncbi:quinone oxidoreductase [Inquilinus sp. CAU 1745]|uniref:quinone oxidoreductase family protein n=1 Tax=Inquilinus sp. CAU 1745 TaxID=3140369 RepID=UPI00325BE9E8